MTFIARGAHLEAMQKQGLKVVGLEEFHLPTVQAVANPAGLAPADLIIFAVKSYDTDGSIELIRPIVGPNTTILPIQNGVESYDRIGGALGRDRVIGGLCRISVEIQQPGVIQINSTFCDVVCGEMDGSASDRTATIAATLTGAGIPTKVTASIRADLWKKFTFITAMSGITGAARMTLGPIREVPEAFELYRRIAAEVVAVANAEGVPVSLDLPDALAKQAMDLPPKFKASLLVDLERGKVTEVETLQGTVVRLGRKHGIPTPVTEVIYALIKLQQPH